MLSTLPLVSDFLILDAGFRIAAGPLRALKMESASLPRLYSSISAPNTPKPVVPSLDDKEDFESASADGGPAEAPPAYSARSNLLETGSISTFRCRFDAITTNPDLYFAGGRISAPEHDCTIILSASGLNNTDWQVSKLLEQARLPPKPMIRLKGSHRNQTTTVVDFDIRFDMAPYFTGDLHHMTIPAHVPHNNSEDEIQMLLRRRAKAFQSSSHECKALVLERKVTNWDTSYLERKLRKLVREAFYSGHLEVSFPVRYARVRLQNVPKEYTIPAPEPQEPASLRSRLGQCFHRNRRKTAQHTLWDCYAIRTIWPYASGSSEDWGRKAIKQDEEAWFERWSGPIRSAVLKNRRTWMTEQHYMTFKAGLDSAKQPKYGWGSDVPSRPAPA